jgi:gas vesicle protein
MKFSWLVKHKLFLFGLSIQLAAMSFFPFIQNADAATEGSGGFIIQADRVVGENMKATVIAGETSGTKAKPMLRITYDSAQIYGMRLTKQFQTPGGTVSITMRANGPVHIKGMQVDTSAISFKGACVYAAKVIPNAALEGVTMVVHSMNASNSSLEQLQLQTVNGDGGVQKPGTLKILQDLGSMPFEQMKKEIGKITSGQLPLTCEGAPEEEGELADVTDPAEDALDGVTDPVDDLTGEVTDPLEDTIGKVTDPLEDTIGKVTDPLEDTIGKVTDPLEGTIGKVTDPIQDTADKVTGPVKDTVEKVTSPVKDTVGKVTEPVKETVKKTTDTAKTVIEPVVEPVTKTVDQSAETSCEKLEAANGKITKELALELIDMALEENKLLEELCPTEATLTEELKKWSEGLLDSPGLLSLAGIKLSEEEQLKKMREAIAKEPDGSVIPFE